MGDKVMSINDVREKWAVNYMMAEPYREKHHGKPLVLWVEGKGGLRRIEIPVDQGKGQDPDARNKKYVMGVRWRWVQAKPDTRIFRSVSAEVKQEQEGQQDMEMNDKKRRKKRRQQLQKGRQERGEWTW